MEIELILVEQCDSAVTALEVFRTLGQQLDLLYHLPGRMSAAGLDCDDGRVLALLGMIEATARRRIDELDNQTPTLSAPWSEPANKGSQETRAGPTAMSTRTVRLQMAPTTTLTFAADLTYGEQSLW